MTVYAANYSQCGLSFDAKLFIRGPVFFVGPTGGIKPDWGIWNPQQAWVGEAYSQEWDMPDASVPVTYSILSGTLPLGLSLIAVAQNRAKISGTPTTAGSYAFTIRATNSFGTADKIFSITVNVVSGTSDSAYTCVY